MNISSDLLTSTISPPVTPAPRPEGEASSPVSIVPSVDSTGVSLSDDDRGAMMSAARDLQDSGAGMDEIRSMVNSEMESRGADTASGSQNTGMMVDMFA